MARRHEHEEHTNHEAWAIPYGDLITLLLAFFVVMYAVSSVNEGKYRVLSDSMMAAFRGSPKTTEPIQIGDKAVRFWSEETLAGLSPSQVMKLPEQRQGDQAGLLERFGRAGLEDSKAGATDRDVAALLKGALDSLIARDLVTVTRKPLWVEVEIKTDILFPSGSAEIEASAVDVLNRVADILRPLTYRLRVEGHTDNRPIATTQFPSNWELSGARASRIVRLLESRGVDPARMSVAGQGEHQPVADNATPEGRNRNRRVVLLILDRNTAAMTPETAATPEASS